MFAARLDIAKEEVRSEYKEISLRSMAKESDNVVASPRLDFHAINKSHAIDNKSCEEKSEEKVHSDLITLKARHEESIKLLEDELSLARELEKRKLAEKLERKKAAKTSIIEEDIPENLEDDMAILHNMTEVIIAFLNPIKTYMCLSSICLTCGMPIVLMISNKLKSLKER